MLADVAFSSLSFKFYFLVIEWSQIGTVQAVGYIGTRSPTKGHGNATNQLSRIEQPMILATGTYLREGSSSLELIKTTESGVLDLVWYLTNCT